MRVHVAHFSNPLGHIRHDRYTQLAVAASKMEMEDCGIDISTIDFRRWQGIRPHQGHKMILIATAAVQFGTFVTPKTLSITQLP